MTDPFRSELPALEATLRRLEDELAVEEERARELRVAQSGRIRRLLAFVPLAAGAGALAGIGVALATAPHPPPPSVWTWSPSPPAELVSCEREVDALRRELGACQARLTPR